MQRENKSLNGMCDVKVTREWKYLYCEQQKPPICQSLWENWASLRLIVTPGLDFDGNFGQKFAPCQLFAPNTSRSLYVHRIDQFLGQIGFLKTLKQHNFANKQKLPQKGSY